MKNEYSIKAIVKNELEYGYYTVYIFNSKTKIVIPVKVTTKDAYCIMECLYKKSYPRPTVYNTVKEFFL